MQTPLSADQVVFLTELCKASAELRALGEAPSPCNLPEGAAWIRADGKIADARYWARQAGCWVDTCDIAARVDPAQLAAALGL